MPTAILAGPKLRYPERGRATALTNVHARNDKGLASDAEAVAATARQTRTVTPRNSRQASLSLAAVSFAVGTDGFVTAGLLPLVSKSLDVSVASAGQMVTLYALAYAIAAPVMAALIASWPRRLVLLVGLCTFVAANLATAAAPTLAWLLVSRAAAGTAGSLATPTAMAAASELVPPERRGRALAIVVGGLSFATALGSPLGLLIAAAGHWRTTLFFVAALGVAAAIGVARTIPASRPSSPAPSMKARLIVVRDLRVLRVLITSFAAFTGYYVVYTYIAVVLQPAAGNREAVLTALLVMYGVSGLVGNHLAGQAVDRWGPHRVGLIALLVSGGNMAILSWTRTSLPAAAVAMTIWGLSAWSMPVVQSHRLVTINPATAPLLTGLNSSIVYLAVSSAACAGGAALTWSGPSILPILAAACVALAVASVAGAYRSPVDSPASTVRFTP
ncbi:MFS transporter [Kribbella sp. NPDC026611]|uniref:MFS transporter n=1 Tax=Kribbella sp. NPDC026611 TaxID=3154911 RepID=UPI0033DF67E8